MAKPLKKLESYLLSTSAAHKTSLDAYAACPAEAFLTYVCDAHDSFVHCLNKFTKKQDGNYNKDSEDSLRHISCALLGTILGHFETYQKALFAGLVERSNLFTAFEVERFLTHFSKNAAGLEVSPGRLLAFRTLKAPVGSVLADSLSGWHSPSRVNILFKAFGIKQDMFGSSEISDLEVLWQLRHSIVHTGAWLTHPDAHKLRRLRDHAGKPVIFEPNFINAVARRFHRIVRDANKRLLADCKTLVGPGGADSAIGELDGFLAVKSPKQVWL